MHSNRWVESILTSGATPGTTWLLLSGGSMEPAYSDGDWLLVEPVSTSRPARIGEVVIARRSDRLVSHRLVALRDGLALTRGDACARLDPAVQIGALIGRVVDVRRRGRVLGTVRRVARRVRSRLRAHLGRER
jgi:phage repressor protein C with HTH and peptisase S24 domain